jgi:hypothetical protein
MLVVEKNLSASARASAGGDYAQESRRLHTVRSKLTLTISQTFAEGGDGVQGAPVINPGGWCNSSRRHESAQSKLHHGDPR